MKFVPKCRFVSVSVEVQRLRGSWAAEYSEERHKNGVQQSRAALSPS